MDVDSGAGSISGSPSDRNVVADLGTSALNGVVAVQNRNGIIIAKSRSYRPVCLVLQLRMIRSICALSAVA